MAKLVFDKESSLDDIKATLKRETAHSSPAVSRIEFLASGATWSLTDSEVVDHVLPVMPVSSTGDARVNSTNTPTSGGVEKQQQNVLLSLTVDGARNFTNRSLSALIDRCGASLQHVRFADCHSLDAEEAVLAVGRYCRRLRSIAIKNRFDDDNVGDRGHIREGKVSKPEVEKSGHNPSNGNGVTTSATPSPFDAKVVSSLIRVAGAAELTSISFVGFRSVVDVDVGYLADCYQQTLRRVELSWCPALTDVGLTSLIERCGPVDRLRDVSFAGTCVTDAGAAALAAGCPRIRRVDLSNCPAITDRGVRALAVGCRRLERVSFAGCSQVSDAGLESLIRNCTALASVDVSRTSLKTVTPLVLAAARLSRLNVDDCKHLTSPPLDVCLRGIDVIRQFYRQYNPSSRLRIVVVGDRLTGKTSLIRRLTAGCGICNSNSPTNVTPAQPPEPTDTVDTFLWQPLAPSATAAAAAKQSPTVNKVEPMRNAGGAGRKSDAEMTTTSPISRRQPLLELWDITGRQICQGIQQLVYAGGAVYVVVFNVADKMGCDRLPSHINAIHQKAPGSIILLVGTHVDKMAADGDAVEQRLQDVIYNVQDSECRAVENIKTEIEFLRITEQTTKVLRQTEKMKTLLDKRPKLPSSTSEIFLVSCVEPEQGIDSLRSTLMNATTDTTRFPHLNRSVNFAGVSLMTSLLRLRATAPDLKDRTNYEDGLHRNGLLTNGNGLHNGISVSPDDDNSEQQRKLSAGGPQHRDQRAVILTWANVLLEAKRDEPELLANDEVFETELNWLQIAGVCIEFRLPEPGHVIETGQSPARFICIDPATFAKLLCLAHLDGKQSRLSFRIDAERFWPRALGWTRPAPRDVIQALEDVPSRGLLRECLLPVLWQDFRLPDAQLNLVLDVLQRLGLLRQCSTSIAAGVVTGDVDQSLPVSTERSLTLHGYPSLSSQRVYYVTLADLVPVRRPQLHWNGRPSKGDIQINWRYELPNGVPYGLKCRLMALCWHIAVNESRATYRHVWNDGVLFCIDDTTMCVEYMTKKIDVCCRVNADEHGRESVAVEYLWAQLSGLVLVVQQFLDCWPGLFYKTSLVPQGLALYNGDVIVMDRSFPLLQCLQIAERSSLAGGGAAVGTGVIRFVDDNIRRALNVRLMIPYSPSSHNTVESWLLSIYERRQLVFSLVDKTDDVLTTSDDNNEHVSGTSDDVQSIRSPVFVDRAPFTDDKPLLQPTFGGETVAGLTPPLTTTTSTLKSDQRSQSRIKISVKWDLGNGVVEDENYEMEDDADDDDVMGRLLSNNADDDGGAGADELSENGYRAHKADSRDKQLVPLVERMLPDTGSGSVDVTVTTRVSTSQVESRRFTVGTQTAEDESSLADVTSSQPIDAEIRQLVQMRNNYLTTNLTASELGVTASQLSTIRSTFCLVS